MKQLGNLAIVCARRSDVILMVIEGEVHVYPQGSASITPPFTAAWDDDDAILSIIHDLNFPDEESRYVWPGEKEVTDEY